MNLRRGEIVLADLEPVKGSEQGKIRPCLVVQNDVGNLYSTNTIVVPITSTIPDKNYPTIVLFGPQDSGLKDGGTILCNQIRTVSVPHRVIRKLGSLRPELMAKVDDALKATLNLD